MKNLPLASMSFNSIIKGNFIYVDKTDILSNLLSLYNPQFFLSRPRRFGKSLLLSTISEIFQGNSEPFTGLKIFKTGYQFVKNPVIKLDMAISSYNIGMLESDLFETLNNRAIQDGFTLKKTSPNIAIKNLVNTLYEKYNQAGVVVLIDEYDDPVSSNLDNPELAKSNNEILRSFYSAFKTLAQEDKLRFVLVTGVTRYAMLGISAGFNNLTDISFRPEYASICGFTPEELDINFSDYYPAVLKSVIAKGYMTPGSDEADLRQNILDYYDGYSWDGLTRVLNPFSLVKFFDEAKFSNFWRNTYPSLNLLTYVIGNYTSSFIPGEINAFKDDDFAVSLVDQNLSPITLFHTGYLTIEKAIVSKHELMYCLKIPNKEVKDDVYTVLAKKLFFDRVKDFSQEFLMLKNAIIEKNSVNLTAIINAFYAGLVHRHHIDNESFYHSLLWAYCKGLFNYAKMEEPGSIGDLDLLLKFENNILAIIEFKYGYDGKNTENMLSKLALEALRTIELKQYGQEYRIPGNTVIDIGVGVYGRGQALAVFR